MPALSIPFVDYLEIKAVHWTTLKQIRESPLHYLNAVTNEREDTSALIKLRAVHTATLEPEKFEQEYPIFEGKTRRGKEWDAFEAANMGKSILKSSELEDIFAARDAIQANPVAAEYLRDSKREVSIKWTDKKTGLELKGRIDAKSYSKQALVDLKAGPTEARLFGKLAARMGYHNQSRLYYDGNTACFPEEAHWPSVLIVYEPKPPFDVVVYRWRDSAMAEAGRHNDELLARVAECRKTGIYPGRYAEEQSLELPQWMTDGEDADEFDEVETTEGDDL